MNRHNIGKACTILLTCFLLTGCWNARELTDLSIITAFGVDKTDEGLYKVSFQVVNAGSVATGQEGAAGNLSPIVVFSEEGNTLYEAIRKATTKISRKIYFPHTRLIVIGENLAREDGVKAFLDWFERDHEFRTNVELVVARGISAESIIQFQSTLERISANKIADQLETSEKAWGENVVVQLGDVLNSLIGNGKEVVISGVSFTGNVEEARDAENLMKSIPPGQLAAQGIGVFKDGKLMEWLDHGNARGFNWITDNIQSTIVNLACENEDQKRIAIEIIRSNTSIHTNVEGDIPKITIQVNAEGNIGEVNCPIDLMNVETMIELKNKLNEKIKSEIVQSVEVVKELNSDIFGFGGTINRQHRKDWDKLKENWDEKFSQVEVKVEVETFIRRTGMNNNNFLTK